MLDPLLSLHQEAGAEFQPYADRQIVATFGFPQAEYAAIHKGAAIMDLSHRGVLELTGRDRHVFLNNLLTNQTYDKQAGRGMELGSAVYAFFLNNKGRIFADMNVIELGERTFLEMDARMVEPVRQTLEKYLFAEQVVVVNRVGQLHVLLITGPGALQLVGTDLSPMRCATSRLLGTEVVLFRDDLCGVPGIVLICGAGEAATLWLRFAARPPEQVAGINRRTAEADPAPARELAVPVGWAAFNAARIEAGRPLFGVDFDDSVLPAETGQLDRAVSFTKGCYLGQEVVARMHARGQVARRLVGIRMEADALPIAGTKVLDDQGNEVGGITSSTVSPVLSNACIAMGYVRRPLFEIGTRVRVPAEGAIRTGVVVELPFAGTRK